ncbi:MAG: YraN family protein [bacterium]|nr:YraN family protein [bacterium]
MNNKEKGNLGETLAAQYLEKSGYEIIERNWHYSRLGEIDIIALDRDTLVFVEVKARKTTSFGHPFEAIDDKKYNQVHSIANAYMAQTEVKFKACRIDGISVILSNPPEITHLKNLF